MEKYNKLLVILIVVIVLAMSIGYSALNSDLSISGEVNYRPQSDVRITSFTTTSDKPSEMTIQYSDFSKHEIKLGYTTTAPCSITYTVKVKNASGANIGILNINNLDENVKVQDNIVGTKLVGPADTKEFTITFNSTKDGTNTYTYLLTFDFEEVYTITYNGFSDTENFKKEILGGQDYSQNFGSNFPNDVEITMGGIPLKNYTYSEGTLTIPNVTGNIVINGMSTPEFHDTSGANAPELNGDMIPVVYDEFRKSWVKQDLEKSYDYSQQVWANAVTVKESIKIVSSLGVENKDLVNNVLPNYKSTNQNVNNSTSNLTLVYNATSNGKITFDWRVSSEKYDKLTITVTINDQSEKIVDGLGEEKSGHYESTEITAGSTVKIVADFKKDPSSPKYEDTAYITNLTAPWPAETESTGKYSWTNEAEYLISSGYEDIDETTEMFSLTNADGHSFSSSDIGKYICLDGTTSCSEVCKITKVEGNAVKEIEKYIIDQFKLRESYIKAPAGTAIKMDDINTMWVWIPRYSYTIKSEDEVNYYGKATFGNKTPTQVLPGEIDVKFISKETDSEKGIAQYIGDSATGWRTNEAFDFPVTDEGNKNTPTKRGGIWVGKFETTGSLPTTSTRGQTCTDISCDVSNVTVKPNLVSLSSQTISSFFFMSRSMQLHNASTYGFDESSGDLHMMKNDEWGSVAYLSQSKYGKYGNSNYTGANKEVYANNNRQGRTGYSGGKPSATEAETSYEYNDMTNLSEGQGQAGPGASTTGNIYGIYDMSGGTEEYVMGVLEYDEQEVYINNGKIATGSSGFNGLDENGKATGNYDLPNEKYYNKYKSADPTSSYMIPSIKLESACNGEICYGHGLSEMLGRIGNYYRSWYGDDGEIVTRRSPWFTRGGHGPGSDDRDRQGIFNFNGIEGVISYVIVCRLTLVP